MMDALSGTSNLSRDPISLMLSSNPSTPPPPPPSPSGNKNNIISAPNSMGVAGNSMGVAGGGGGTNLPYASSSINSNLTTSITSSATNRITTATNVTNVNTNSSLNRDQVYLWIQELSSPETREHALIELSRKREVLPDLAPMLWHSFGTIAALLQEIVMIYPVINPPTLNVRECLLHNSHFLLSPWQPMRAVLNFVWGRRVQLIMYFWL